MDRWHVTLGLAALTLAAGALAPRLFPTAVEELTGASPIPTTIESPPPFDPLAESAPARVVDVVIALDTSGSMDALIDSVRSRLWEIVNTIDAEDPDAELRVGVLAFGSPEYGRDNGYIRVVSPLTSDLDDLYTSVFALQTSGGDEFVGSTIQHAMLHLDWAPQNTDDDRRLLFVAGNEGAHQGPVPVEEIARKAREQGILVSALYAGSEGSGRTEGWEAVAAAGGGRYLSVDAQDSAQAVASTPFDSRIEALNEQLNGTYMAFGASGEEKLQQMKDNDRRAKTIGVGAIVGRAGTKGGGKYKTASWDLVEAVDKNPALLHTLEDHALPAELQGLAVDERAQRVEEMSRARLDTKRQLEALTQQRKRHLKAEAKAKPSKGLDAEMNEALTDLL